MGYGSDNKHVGECVKVVDEVGSEHDALVTGVWGEWDDEPAGPCSINTVYVTDDPSKTDQYGRQIDRHLTSVQHKTGTDAPGRYWYVP